MVKEKGFTLEGARHEINALRNREDQKKEIINQLQQIHKDLTNLLKEL